MPVQNFIIVASEFYTLSLITLFEKLQKTNKQTNKQISLQKLRYRGRYDGHLTTTFLLNMYRTLTLKILNFKG